VGTPEAQSTEPGAVAQDGQSEQDEPAPERARLKRPPWAGQRIDVPYGVHPRQTLDYYPVPLAEAPTPLAVFFHAGGFAGGDKLMARAKRGAEYKALQQAGIACAFVNYRLAPEFHFPVPVRDAGRAVQFLRAHADEYGIDPGRLVYLGYSAGAVLAGTLAYGPDLAAENSPDPVARQSTRPVAWLSVEGPMDFRLFTPHRRVPYFGDMLLKSLDAEVLKLASPAWHLARSTEPVIPCFLAYNLSKRETPPVLNPHDASFGLALLETLRARGDRVSVLIDKQDKTRDWISELPCWFQERF